MDADEARAVIRTQHNAVLATLRRDGTPQMTPVGAAVDAEGRVVISSRKTAYKVANLGREPPGVSLRAALTRRYWRR